MLDYVFFDPDARVRFLAFLADLNVATETSEDTDDGTCSVWVSEDLDDELGDRIDAEYDRLMIEQANDVDAESGYAVNLVGVQYTRPDGGVGVVRLQPATMNQITQCLTVEELQRFVQHVADEIAAGLEGPVCRVLSQGLDTP
ncbi:MAG: hypothetical protein H6981_05565 [Gammaproteobacteria bacterium]|nr:hypothetical protein [Gammaproteobacteria bacterium]MCP5136251.1 hypothetical protein [Gammaproteobacteria bacterium]